MLAVSDLLQTMTQAQGWNVLKVIQEHEERQKRERAHRVNS